eukprot:1375299-Amorphochlora_amoeboformis.AAC.1
MRAIKPDIELEEPPVSRILCAMEPARLFAGQGNLGRNGRLGVGDEKIIVNGVPREKGLGLHAKKGITSYVVYNITRSLPRPLVVR